MEKSICDLEGRRKQIRLLQCKVQDDHIDLKSSKKNNMKVEL